MLENNIFIFINTKYIFKLITPLLTLICDCYYYGIIIIIPQLTCHPTIKPI